MAAKLPANYRAAWGEVRETALAHWDKALPLYAEVIDRNGTAHKPGGQEV